MIGLWLFNYGMEEIKCSKGLCLGVFRVSDYLLSGEIEHGWMGLWLFDYERGEVGLLVRGDGCCNLGIMIVDLLR